ncbi:hypothetical protein [Flavobacterium sp.]|uniref:hypothetical protein n=1 Tax=Flavobacterium sp. TaxID=239 RepID=UPI00391BF0B9
MKTKIVTLSILTIWSITTGFAQNRTTVSANNSEISDNLDLRAVASIFGDSRNLEDFERRLNDPKVQISNLDLNQDNQVDYLRVIESVEGNAHLIVIQSVIGRDTFQDVATVEVERDRFNRVQVQVVGDVFMYGNNYIYEPVYAYTPVIYNSFWVGNYTPYCSSWYWGFYPNYYYSWTPFPIFRYRSNIGFCINNYHHYNYVNYRRCEVAYNSYRGRRGNAYEIRYPNRSFNQRNENYANRYELDNSRSNQTTTGNRNQTVYTNTRNFANNSISTRGNSNQRTEIQSIGTSRNYYANNNTIRVNSNPRNETQSIGTPRNYYANNNTIRVNSNPRNETQSIGTPRNYNANNTIRVNSNSRSVTQQNQTPTETIRNNNPRENNYSNASSRNSSSGKYSNQRMNTERVARTSGNPIGNKRG